MKKVALALSVMVFSLILAGCTTSTSSVQPSDTPAETQPAVEAVATDEVINVEMANYRFNPNVIRAKAGTTLKLNITDTQGSHDFVIDELNVDSGVFQTGESKEIMIEIPAGDAGKTFEFYCSVMNHRQMGMVGQLIIE
jgi:plastocyanin